jgi:hypothetical protein
MICSGTPPTAVATHRKPRRHGFEDVVRKAFVMGRADVGIGGRQDHRNVIAFADEAHVSRQSGSALSQPGRPGVRVIAKQFGVDPSTVQRIGRPFDEAASAAG